MKKNGKVVSMNLNVRYYKDDKLHREDGPAMEYFDGHKEWYLNGKLHREDGPAIEYPSGNKSWYLNDVYYCSEENHKIALRQLKLDRIRSHQ